MLHFKYKGIKLAGGVDAETNIMWNKRSSCVGKVAKDLLDNLRAINCLVKRVVK